VDYDTTTSVPLDPVLLGSLSLSIFELDPFQEYCQFHELYCKVDTNPSSEDTIEIEIELLIGFGAVSPPER
jgi:hypothetical protein